MIETDVAALFESGCSLVVGTVGPDLVPDAARAWGAEVVDGGAALRVLVASDATTTLANLRSTGVVAVTATEVATLRSVQVKGRARVDGPASEADLERSRRHVEAFFAAVEATEGTPPARLSRLLPAGFTAFVTTADELYDQTPGPRAGARLDAHRP